MGRRVRGAPHAARRTLCPGGSLPIAPISDVLNVPFVIVPLVNHDNNEHAVNENLRLKNLWDGIEAYAVLLTGLDWTPPRHALAPPSH